MEIKDQITVAAPPELIIEEMQRPDVLEKTIPNCSNVEQNGERKYTAEINEKISMVSIDINVDIEIVEFNPPDFFAVTIDGTAPKSNSQVNVEAKYHLSNLDTDQTLIEYSMNIEVSGKLASLGFRVLRSTVNKRVEQMADNIEDIFAEDKAF